MAQGRCAANLAIEINSLEKCFKEHASDTYLEMTEDVKSILDTVNTSPSLSGEASARNLDIIQMINNQLGSMLHVTHQYLTTQHENYSYLKHTQCESEAETINTFREEIAHLKNAIIALAAENNNMNTDLAVIQVLGQHIESTIDPMMIAFFQQFNNRMSALKESITNSE